MAVFGGFQAGWKNLRESHNKCDVILVDELAVTPIVYLHCLALCCCSLLHVGFASLLTPELLEATETTTMATAPISYLNHTTALTQVWLHIQAVRW